MKIWDAKSGFEQYVGDDFTSTVESCAVSPDGTRIVSASSDQTLRMWDVDSGQELRTLAGHTEWVMGCAVSPDGKWITSASSDKTLKVWEADSEAGSTWERTYLPHPRLRHAIEAQPVCDEDGIAG